MTRQFEQHTARAWVEVDLGALRRNAATLAERAGVPILPMVKADAYGLGAVPVVRALEPLDVWGYGVATVAEGVELREAGVLRPIVVFTPLLVPDLVEAQAARLTPVLSTAIAIARWGAIGGGPWHLGIDTGMSRSGVRWDLVGELRDVLLQHPPQGACTHFHSAERNDGSCDEQEGRFARALEQLPARPPVLHAENSAAIVRRPQSAWTVVRPGVLLYGVGSGPGAEHDPLPVARLRARVVDVRALRDGETVSYGAGYRAVGDRRIATLAIGYADGYVRALGNRGMALVNGRRVPVAGVVTMDMTMLDITDVPCDLGDVATLLGDDGDERLDAETVARTADISPYELLTGLRAGRLSHTYVDADRGHAPSPHDAAGTHASGASA